MQYAVAVLALLVGCATRGPDRAAADAGTGSNGAGGSPTGGSPPQRPPAPAAAAAGMCERSGWCWYNPLPQGRWVAALWAASPNDVWQATDELGAILHRQGGGWARVETVPGLSVTALWGASAGDVWAAGADRSVAPGPAVIPVAVIAHWDGTRWTEAWRGDGMLSDIAGSGPANVWAAGSDIVVRWDGHAWARADVPSMTLPPDFQTRDTALIGTVAPVTPDDVWVAGSHFIWHWNGAAWSRQELPDAGVDRLWAAGAQQVYAAGARTSGPGLLLRWDGATWSEALAADGGFDTWKVTGSGPRDVWVFGFTQTVRHFDGATWTASTIPAQGAVMLVASPSLALAAVSNQTFVRAGADGGWQPFTTGATGLFASASGAGADDVWFGSSSPAAMLGHWNGATFETLTVPLPAGKQSAGAGVSDVWAAGGGEVWFAGPAGLLGRRTPDGWTQFDVTSEWLNGIWGTDGNDVWAAGDNGTVLHWDGAGWTQVQEPGVALPGASFRSVRGSGRDDVWLAAKSLLHWDGKGWSQIATLGFLDAPPQGLWVNGPDDVWVAAAGGNWAGVGHFDGTQFTTLFTFDKEPIFDVWSPGPGEAWLAGNPTRRIRDGALTYPDLPTGTASFWGSSERDIWAGGYYESAILRNQQRQ